VSLIRKAITEADGQTLNVGYLSLFWLFIAVIGAVQIEALLAIIASIRTPDKIAEILQSLGVAVGATCGGFATALTALGVYIKLDPPKSQPIAEELK
jgi:hypothetical protein